MKADRSCVLLFSGGRDSTIAAVRLGSQAYRQTLLTVSSPDMVGLSSVLSRLEELAKVIQPFDWYNVVLEDHAPEHVGQFPNCFACQHAYLAVAARVARQVGTDEISVGYSGYQAHWPEQSRLAIESLISIFAGFGYRCTFPVYDLTSKQDAENELAQAGLSTRALEQKCIRQIIARELPEAEISHLVTTWGRALEANLREPDSLPFRIATVRRFGGSQKSDDPA